MKHILIHSLEHAFHDSLKILPFLFITYLMMEFLEKKTGEKTNLWLEKAGKAGPVAGGVLGIIPQCGMSAVASNLYAGKIISVGTLLAIYLSTSDEMLPIMISQSADDKPITLVAGASNVISRPIISSTTICVEEEVVEGVELVEVLVVLHPPKIVTANVAMINLINFLVFIISYPQKIFNMQIIRERRPFHLNFLHAFAESDRFRFE